MRANRCLAVAAVIWLAYPAFGQVADDEPATLPEPAQEPAVAAPDQPAGGPPAEQGAPPVEVLWQSQRGTPDDDWGMGVGVDSDGNCYVTGVTSGQLGQSQHGRQDVVLMKCDRDGDPLWTRQTGSADTDGPHDIAVDGQGSCFVTGQTSGDLAAENAGGKDAFLLKYDHQGSLLWQRQIGTSETERGLAVAVDADDNSYVCGTTWGDLTDEGEVPAGADIFIAKYDADGTQVWLRQLDVRGEDAPGRILVVEEEDGTQSEWDTADLAESAPCAIVIADDGTIYVAGSTFGTIGGDGHGGEDAFILHLDSEGQWLACDQFGTAQADEARDIALDTDGNCYVVGNTTDESAVEDGGPSVFIAKYDKDCVQQWLVHAEAEERYYARALAVNAAGIYVVGATGDPAVLRDSSADAILTKYDWQGRQEWQHTFGSDVWDMAADIAVDTGGNCHITGSSRGPMAGDHQGRIDTFIIVFSPTGDSADDNASDDFPRDGPDDAPDDDAPADDPAGNSSAE